MPSTLRLSLVLVSALLTLAGCNRDRQGDQAGGVPSSSPSAASAAAARPQPGQYRTTIRVVGIAFPGMDPAMTARMKAMFGANGHASEYCLTPQQTGGYEEMTRRAARGDCRYDRFTAAGGVIDAAITCQTGQGMTARSRLHGSFSSAGSRLTMATDTSGGGLPGAGMHMEAEITSERIGDCP